MPAIELSPNEKYLSRRIDGLEKEIQELRDRVQETLEIINVVINKIEKNMEKHDRVVKQLNKITMLVEAVAEQVKVKEIIIPTGGQG